MRLFSKKSQKRGTMSARKASMSLIVQGPLRLLDLKAALLAWLFCCQPVTTRHILTGQSNEASVLNATAARRQAFTLGAYAPMPSALRPSPSLRLAQVEEIYKALP